MAGQTVIQFKKIKLQFGINLLMTTGLDDNVSDPNCTNDNCLLYFSIQVQDGLIIMPHTPY